MRRNAGVVVVDQADERVVLGHITGVSGLKGWIKVHSDTSPRENIVSYSTWWLEQAGKWRQVNVVSGRPQGKTIVAQIEGVSTPEQAEMLIKARIAVNRAEMPKLSGQEYYWADLVGMQVRTIDGVFIGPVDRLFETGANDVLVVSDTRVPDEEDVVAEEKSAGRKPAVSKGLKEVLVPWLVPDVITDVDLQSKMITIDWDPDF